MTERNEVIRNAFQDDSLGPFDRDRLWSTMQHRQTRQARLRFLVRAGALLLAGAIIAAVVFLRRAPRTTDRRLAGPVAIAADSITTNFPTEPSMIQQEPAREDVPSNLIPLLGHRSSLQMDISRYEAQIDALSRRVNSTRGVEHDVVTRQLSEAEHQLTATKAALAVVDRELSGHQGTVSEYVSVSANEPPQVFQFGGLGYPTR